jgi:hypothetical protein
VLWATGGRSDSWQIEFSLGFWFLLKIGESWQNQSHKPAIEGNVTHPSAVQSLHSHTIDPMNDIGLCYGQVEATLAHGRDNFQLVSAES